MRNVRVTLNGAIHRYEIKIGRGLLPSCGEAIRRAVGKRTRRVVIVSNEQVFALYGSVVMESLLENNFCVSTFLMGEGEKFKSVTTLNKALGCFSKAALERSDAVVALGGGVVGDLAGFAAAIYLRGISYFQLPTTLLSQIDSSVGGKTGVNTSRSKNTIGAFHQPSGVLIDFDTLCTLPARELTAGLCEMVKNGALCGPDLFGQTIALLKSDDLDSPADAKGLETLIAANCKFKASIVAGDEHEAIKRSDRRSRRILNFGHTVGHGLEAVTNYRRFRHGEAVGYGILAANELAKNLGLMKISDVESIGEAIRLCGRLPKVRDINAGDVFAALEHDKKNVAGNLQWVLLEKIGKPRIVDGASIPTDLIRQSISAIVHGNLK